MTARLYLLTVHGGITVADSRSAYATFLDVRVILTVTLPALTVILMRMPVLVVSVC